MKPSAIPLIVILLAACNPEPAQNSKALAQEMRDRKIKRVTPAQLAGTVDEWGKAVVAEAQTALTAELTKRGDKSLCQPTRLAAVRRLEKLYAARIDLVSAGDVKNESLPAKEREILDAYLYNAEQKLAQTDNVQKVADTLFVYNAAVPADNVICRTCTDNAALPFVVWRVVFNKREVIRRINPRKLK